jgi:predicted kinase
MLVVFSGLPGAGKSAIADEVGRRLPAPVFSVDPIEAAIWRCGIPRSHETGVAAYEVAAALAEHQLRLGLVAIGDAVNSLEVARELWRRAARHVGSPMAVIEVICTDDDLHRTRLATRARDIEGFPELTCDDVQARRDEWEEWNEDRLVLDSTESLTQNVECALTYVRE